MNDDPTLYAQDRAARATPWDEAAFGRTFRREIATVNGDVRIHYVVGGEGPPLVLLHGFLQHWREWPLGPGRASDLAGSSAHHLPQKEPVVPPGPGVGARYPLHWQRCWRMACVLSPTALSRRGTTTRIVRRPSLGLTL